MQLKYTKSIKKRVISIELETTGFTTNETKALDLFGEPEVVLEKTYAGGFPISINKKIRTGFKVKAKIRRHRQHGWRSQSSQRFL